MTVLNTAIGLNIKQIRKSKKISQAELARIIGMKPAVISKYETGMVEPSISQCEKIAEALEVEVSELFEAIVVKHQGAKAMISQPMAGKTDEEIVETRNRAIAFLESKDYEVINTLFTDEWYSQERMNERGVVQIPLCFLAKSLENMSLCHTAYFCKGWEKATGCRIEHKAAKAYGVAIIYEQ